MNDWKRDAASNRQRKALHFFGAPSSPGMTKGEAARYITAIFASPENRLRWNQYVFLTNDVDSDTADLKSFEPEKLKAVVLPFDWEVTVGRRLKKAFQARAKSMQAEGALFENPEPAILFSEKRFCFTGKFEFGSRKACQSAIEGLGGIFDPDVGQQTGYLIVGKLGNDQYAETGYGRKIEWAIVSRAEYGTPLIVSEDHWIAALRA